MNLARTRRLKVAHTTEGLLLRLVPYGESDAVVTLLTHELGKVSAMARHLRRGRQGSRPIVLEPMHTLRLVLDESPGIEMMVLREARLERVRHRLVRRLDELDVAGQGLRWVRSLAPPRAPEPGLWAEIEALLDHLDQPVVREGDVGHSAAHVDGQGEVVGARGRLAGAGLRMLVATGYGFELHGCARCGRECPDGATAAFDPRKGGLVCQACGGGPFKLSPGLREAMLAATEGDDGALPGGEVEAVLDWVEAALATHLNVSDPKHETRESR